MLDKDTQCLRPNCAAVFPATKNGDLGIKAAIAETPCLRRASQLFLLQERQQILIEAVLVRVGQTVGCAGVNDQLCVLYQLGCRMG